ncbi:hypothetical protein FRAAL0055 [Frankia alni ACN14a]|uniref:Uncharacterized protein n=1 Tax=Frankia alni (strain DSM 45986 / CECT 9034 / ACN14a) TaxID=326424 RepID=Q0RUK1_FRAAA|nr:hypothetical protein FRAAL0055 [Frankia alni ACN14a]
MPSHRPRLLTSGRPSHPTRVSPGVGWKVTDLSTPGTVPADGSLVRFEQHVCAARTVARLQRPSLGR